MIDERLIRNIPALSQEEQEMLCNSHVCVAGCGGLGGYSIEFLARAGIGRLTVIDGDRFEISNRNRQLLAGGDNTGCFKAEYAGVRVRWICPDTEVQAKEVYIDEENAESLLDGADAVVDALDSGKDRLILARACSRLGIPLVHGAVQGWNAQVGVIMPGSGTMEQLYRGKDDSRDKSCLSFTPALCAAIQCAEVLKLLTNHESALESCLLTVDLREMDFVTIPLK